ncbi:MAG: type I DNA topoisomerase [Clostridia bacterium]|nr:type I DNA topoisomerase [Clostridia bacterium]
MAYKLVIVESPAKARTIAKFLGRSYKVEASQGHVRDLPKSQLGVNVEDNFEPHYITIRGRGDILDKIRKEAKGATRVYLATDPDREGEAISWHLSQVLKIPQDEACRIEFNEITSKAVKAAVKTPRKLDMDLVAAQQARRVLDRLVGYKISPLLWAKVRKGLSAGRVQSVACAMIVERENEIDAFQPQEYWNMFGMFKDGDVTFRGKFTAIDGQRVTPASAEEVAAISARAKDAQFKVTSVKRGVKLRHPVAPFTTPSLQQEASRKLGFTTQKTMQIAQQLYEGVDLEGEGTQGIVSYIRTDSTRVSDEAVAAVRALIGEKFGENFLPEQPNEYKGRKNIQDAHEAIRPTVVERTPESIKASLTNDQFKLYRLIYQRFVASQMKPAEYDTMAAEVEGDGIAFHFGGQKLRFAGFMKLYVEGHDDEQEEADTALPNLEEGTEAVLTDLESEQRFTQAPPRYTEASLVRALEEKGIGRPSTYAPTITTLLTRGYVSRENKRLVPNELGIVVTDVMQKHFPDIVNQAFTADMENQLDDVEAGKEDWHDVIGEFYGPFAQSLEKAEASIEKMEIKDEVSDIPCEKCGAMMVYKMGRFGRFLACPNFPECRFTMPILKDIGVPCPECGGKLLERMSKKGRKFFGCEHYPECAFVSWDMPVNTKCPKCGGRMVLKRGRKGEQFHVCINETCNERVLVAQEQENNEE